jgi:hypothetical protein
VVDLGGVAPLEAGASAPNEWNQNQVAETVA